MEEPGGSGSEGGAETVGAVDTGDADARPRGRGWLVPTGLVVLTVAVVALLVVTIALAGRVDTLEDDVHRAEAQARGGGQGISGRVDALEDSVADLEASPGGAPSDGGAAVDEVVDDVDALKKCVNEYMDVIGRWSSDVSTRYDYLYC